MENAEGNRVGQKQSFSSMSEHQRLLQSSKFFQHNEFESADDLYTKGTGNYNQFRRGQLDGYMKINNITYAEAGKYECAVHTGKSFSEARNICRTCQLCTKIALNVKTKQKTTICVHNMFCRYSELTIFMNNEQSVSYCGLVQK